jgi:DNA invertase Pin-like site-specific DNA recombinase
VTHQLFYEIVLEGIYQGKGMGRWDDVLSAEDAQAIHAYLVVTGGTSARPGYQAMLEAARRGEFDAIVAEDLKRLWREQAEGFR